jgi:hypothetical protein
MTRVRFAATAWFAAAAVNGWFVLISAATAQTSHANLSMVNRWLDYQLR